MKVSVPESVFNGLEAVRESGRVNMMDRQGVMVVANDMQAWETVVWLEENKKLYSEGVFRGFKVEGSA